MGYAETVPTRGQARKATMAKDSSKGSLKTFFVKRRVEASSMQDALNREQRGEIVEVWQEKLDTVAMGFSTVGERD